MTIYPLMDTARVIHEVKMRECLWNPRNEGYKHKLKKYKAWVEVSEAVLSKFATSNKYERSQIMRSVQSRWKTARDAYMKCRLMDLKKPTNKSKLKKYVYQDQLRFLELVKDIEEGKVKEEDETSNSIVGENSVSESTFGVSDDEVDKTSDGVMDFDIDIHDDFKEKIYEDATVEEINDKTINNNIEQNHLSLPGPSSQNTDKKAPIANSKPNPSRKRPRNTQQRKIKSKMTASETRLLEILRLINNSSRNTSALQADDQAFFNSLAPLIKNFNNNQKLLFRSKILEEVMAVSNLGPGNVKQELETYVFDDLDDDAN